MFDRKLAEDVNRLMADMGALVKELQYKMGSSDLQIGNVKEVGRARSEPDRVVDEPNVH